MVVDIGVTATLSPVKFPGFQVAELAPATFKVAVVPLQRYEPLKLKTFTVKLGTAFTATETVLPLTHPAVLVPLTV